MQQKQTLRRRAPAITSPRHVAKNDRQKLTVWQRISTFIVMHELVIALLLGGCVIIGTLFLGAENIKVVPLNSDPSARYLAEPSNPLKFMADWDGPNYLQIATHGYTHGYQTNFFPLYPLLISLFHIFGGSPLDVALVISWIGFVGAIYYYLKITKLLFSIKSNLEAVRSVLFFIFFPTGIFLMAVYTESLFACFALAAIYYSWQRRSILAAIAALLACATHIDGAFVLVLIALILWEQRERVMIILRTLVIGCLGLIGYMLYLSSRFHNPLEFITAQQKHGWLDQSIHNPTINIGWLNIVIIAAILLSVYYWWSRRRSFAVYSFLFLLIPIVGGQLGGFNRYALMAFPLQWMLYDKFRSRPVGYSLCLAGCVVLWAYMMFQYVGGYVGG